MTLEEIFNDYTPGSEGFARAVETECGFGMSRDEIRKIGKRAKSADEFQAIWENEAWWKDNAQ